MNLSEDALALLRLRLLGHRREVDDETREAYRELARAGLMEPLHTFTRGRESSYRLTAAAVEHKAEWLSDPAPSIPAPSPEESVASLR